MLQCGELGSNFLIAISLTVYPMRTLGECFARFGESRLRNEGVVKVIPQPAVTTEVDDGGGLVAALVHKEGDAAHVMKVVCSRWKVSF